MALNAFLHFSFRRPKDERYGIFASAVFRDREGSSRAVFKQVQKCWLWEDQQFVSAIQSYERALGFIYEFQGQLYDVGVKTVMLVTDNTTLAKWIQEPKKNKTYAGHMQRANEMYKVGGKKEIILGVGLCVPLAYEKAYKFCKEELVTVDHTVGTSAIGQRRVMPSVDTILTVHDTASEMDLASPEGELKVAKYGNGDILNRAPLIHRMPLESDGFTTIHDLYGDKSDPSLR
jgi:hypothetical protein